MTPRTIALASGLAMVIAMAAQPAAHAVEITVLGGQGVVSALFDLAPAFERATGHKLIVRQENDIAGKVNGDAPADLVAAGPQAIDDYIAKRKVVAGTH